MSHDRQQQTAGSIRAGALGVAHDAAHLPLALTRQAFEHAIDMLEDGIARRDYPSANYGMGRCLFQIAIYVDPVLMGPGRSHEVDELARLQELRTRFEALRPLAPEGDEPTAAAKEAWLNKLGQPPAQDASPSEPVQFPKFFPRPEPVTPLESPELFLSGGLLGLPREVGNVLGGPLFAKLRERETIDLIVNPTGDPVKDVLADALGDLLNDPDFAIGFTAGAMKGTALAAYDSVKGLKDTADLTAEIIAKLATFQYRELLQEAREAINDLVALGDNAETLLGAFAARWKDDRDKYRQGLLQGQVVAYVVTQVAILIATSAAGGEIAAIGGPFARLIETLGWIGDPIGGLIELEAQVPARAVQALRATERVRGGVRGADVLGDGDGAARKALDVAKLGSAPSEGLPDAVHATRNGGRAVRAADQPAAAPRGILHGATDLLAEGHQRPIEAAAESVPTAGRSGLTSTPGVDELGLPVLSSIEEVTGVAKGPAYEDAMGQLRQFYADMEVEAQQVAHNAGVRVDGGYRWAYGNHAQTFSHGLVNFQFRVYLRPATAMVDADGLAKLRSRVHAGIDRFYNGGFSARGPDGVERRIHLEVDFVDDPKDAHLVVEVRPGNQLENTRLGYWFVDGPPEAHAHETAHGAFGIKDEYFDPGIYAPRDRSTPTGSGVRTDHTLMNIVTRDVHRNYVLDPFASLKPRHFDEIGVFTPVPAPSSPKTEP